MPTIKLKLQVLCDNAIAIGPGKADLLERIMATGSISGAAREMGMSYRRAWQLVDVMNRCWHDRLVETTPGRASGGARVTELGVTVVQRYRAMQSSLEACATENGWHELSAVIRDTPLPHQPGNAPPLPDRDPDCEGADVTG
jgi:molybdate transport system regulatory protein